MGFYTKYELMTSLRWLYNEFIMMITSLQLIMPMAALFLPPQSMNSEKLIILCKRCENEMEWFINGEQSHQFHHTKRVIPTMQH